MDGVCPSLARFLRYTVKNVEFGAHLAFSIIGERLLLLAARLTEKGRATENGISVYPASFVKVLT